MRLNVEYILVGYELGPPRKTQTEALFPQGIYPRNIGSAVQWSSL